MRTIFFVAVIFEKLYQTPLRQEVWLRGVMENYSASKEDVTLPSTHLQHYFFHYALIIKSAA